MKKRVALLVVVIVWSYCSCQKEKYDTINEECINSYIPLLEQSTCLEGRIAEYLFQGQLVYLISEGNCIADGTTTVIDHECEVLGFLGGITGNCEINNEDFCRNAEFRRNVWSFNWYHLYDFVHNGEHISSIIAAINDKINNK